MIASISSIKAPALTMRLASMAITAPLIVIMSGEEMSDLKMRSVRLAMLNGKNWVVWKFQLEQIMRANNLLGIIYGSVKRPITITGADTNDRAIVKNQKDNYN